MKTLKAHPNHSIHRNPRLLVSLILSIASAGWYIAPLTVKSQTQAEMTQTASAEFEKADAELNRIYKKLMKIYKAGDPELTPTREAITKAQQAWIKYRDLSAQAMLKVYSGGSMASMQASGLMTELTQKQTNILRHYLPQDDPDAQPEKPRK